MPFITMSTSSHTTAPEGLTFEELQALALDTADLLQNAQEEIQAMREAIKEARTALERCKADRGERDKVLIVTTFALAKLKPFLP